MAAISFCSIGKNYKEEKFIIADPAAGMITLQKEDFLKSWLSTSKENTELGIALLVEPTPLFYKAEDDFSLTGKNKNQHVGLKTLLSYLAQNKKFILQLFLGLLLGSLLQLIFPFLTQSIVDVGINTHKPSIHLHHSYCTVHVVCEQNDSRVYTQPYFALRKHQDKYFFAFRFLGKAYAPPFIVF